MSKLLCAVALILMLSSCAGVTPAFGGKTRLNLKFEDTIDATQDENGNIVSPGQRTVFENTSELPAGVDAADIAQLDYLWNTDQSGSIHISGDKNATTQGQAALQAQYTTQQFEAFTNAFTQLLSAIAPLVGTKIQTDATTPPKVDAITADEIRMLLESLTTK